MRIARLFLVCLVLFSGCDLLNKDDDSDTSHSSSGDTWGTPDRPAVICEVQMCNERRQALVSNSDSTSAEEITLREVTADDVLNEIQTLVERDPIAAEWLRVWLQPDQPHPETSPQLLALARSAPFPQAQLDRITVALDTGLPNWRAPNLGAPLTEPPPSIGVGRYSLETSGCGEMELRMAMKSVQVDEREDNLTGDRIFCIIRAEDKESVELLQTDSSPPLNPGDRHHFQDTIFYGREARRDPGAQLTVSYDCYEIDDQADYDRISEIIDQVEDIGVHLGKLTGFPNASAFLVQAAKVARLLAKLSAVFDGNDHLYAHEETFDRRGLWRLISDHKRTLTARNEHNLSEWSWVFSLETEGCAKGEAPSSGESATLCSASNCRAGCCVGDRCVTTQNNQTCGRGGDACRSCQGVNTCQDGRCEFDPSQVQVDLSVVSARVDRTKRDGRCWDAGCNPPEVYVELASLECNQSTSAQESYSPTWRHVVCPGLRADALTDDVFVRIQDDDLLDDDLIGECWVHFNNTFINSLDTDRVNEVSRDCGSAKITLGVELR